MEFVRGHAAAALGHASTDAIETDAPFTELGFDSLGGVELRNRLAKATGLSLPSTLVFDHPTVEAVAQLLRARIEGEQGRAARERRTTRRVTTDEPIAIVGIGARYPGGVGSADELWRLLADGRDVIGEFPVDRGWDREGLFDPDPDRPGTVYTRFGGFLDGAGDFDTVDTALLYFCFDDGSFEVAAGLRIEAELSNVERRQSLTRRHHLERWLRKRSRKRGHCIEPTSQDRPHTRIEKARGREDGDDT